MAFSRSSFAVAILASALLVSVANATGKQHTHNTSSLLLDLRATPAPTPDSTFRPAHFALELTLLYSAPSSSQLA